MIFLNVVTSTGIIPDLLMVAIIIFGLLAIRKARP